MANIEMGSSKDNVDDNWQSIQIEVPALLAGERLDRVVAVLSGRTRVEIAGLIRSGQVLIESFPVTSRHRRVSQGDLIHVFLPHQPSVQQLEAAPAGSVPFRVMHEDADLLVIDKPAGVVVHPGAGHTTGTLVAGILGQYPDIAQAVANGKGDAMRPGIVHRLDKDTSGLLVVARNLATYDALVAQLAAREMTREYIAAVTGTVLADKGVIDAPLGRSQREPTRIAVVATGRVARTHYVVESRFVHPIEVSVLKVRLETGRTHQIRVHFSAIGHPVLGDTRYGRSAKALGLGRQFLHGATLCFVHPRSGEPVEFHSPLPGDLSELLDLFS